jgi:hypothetical protein
MDVLTTSMQVHDWLGAAFCIGWIFGMMCFQLSYYVGDE